MEDFGAPLTSTDYTLCIYAGPAAARVMEVTAPGGATCAGKPCWKAKGSASSVRRYKFRDPHRTFDGVARVVLRTRPSKARANLVFVGRGPKLPLAELPLAEPVTAQLIKSDGPECWEAHYSAPALKNSPKQFRDRND